MALTTCPKCGEKVSTNAEECVHCGAELNTKMEIDQNIEIEKVISWHLKYARSVMAIDIFLAIIIVIVSLVMIGDTDGLSLFYLIGAFLVVGWGIFISKGFEWKAYLLQQTFEINKKMK